MKKYIEATEAACRYLSDADPVMGGLIASREPIRHELQTEYFETVVSNIVGQQLSGKVADVIWGRFKNMTGGVITPERILNLDENDMRAVGLSFRKAAYIKNLALFSADGKIDFDRFDAMPNEEIVARLTAVKGIGEWTAEMFLIFSLGREDVFSKGDGGLARAIDELYGSSKGREDALSKGDEGAARAIDELYGSSKGRDEALSKGDEGAARAIDELYGRGVTPSKGEFGSSAALKKSELYGSSKNERAKIAEKWSPYRSIASFYLWESLKK